MEVSSGERVAARLLADGMSIYSDDGEKNSRKLAGEQDTTVGELAIAFDRLFKLGIVARNNGDWIIGDDQFGNWIGNRPKSEF